MAEKSLTLQSSNEELKAYFEAVCRIVDSNTNEFPINLDEVWPLVYADKSKAVRALTSSTDFIQDIDYRVLTQNGENPSVVVRQMNTASPRLVLSSLSPEKCAPCLRSIGECFMPQGKENCAHASYPAKNLP